MPRKSRRVETSRFAPAYQTFLALLKKERLKRGLSQRQLSERLGRHHNFVSSCEMADWVINFTEVRAWCEALGLDWVEFTRTVDQALAAQGENSASQTDETPPSSSSKT